MKDGLHEINKDQRDPFLLFPVFPSGLFSDFIYSSVGEKGGGSERVVYTSQLEADRTFSIPVSSLWENAAADPEPLEIPPPSLVFFCPICRWPEGSAAQNPIHFNVWRCFGGSKGAGNFCCFFYNEWGSEEKFSKDTNLDRKVVPNSPGHVQSYGSSYLKSVLHSCSSVLKTCLVSHCWVYRRAGAGKGRGGRGVQAFSSFLQNPSFFPRCGWKWGGSFEQGYFSCRGSRFTVSLHRTKTPLPPLQTPLNFGSLARVSPFLQTGTKPLVQHCFILKLEVMDVETFPLDTLFPKSFCRETFDAGNELLLVESSVWSAIDMSCPFI